MYPELEGGFGPMREMLPMRGIGAKNGPTMNVSETSRIDLNIDFANNIGRGFFANLLPNGVAP